MRKYLVFSLAISLLFLTACSPTATGPAGPTPAPTGLKAISAASFTSGEAFEALPPGDALLMIDAGTLINTTIPNALANSPQQKAEFDKGLVEMQEKAGIDPKQVKLVAMTFNFPKTPTDKPQFAGVMTGSFDTAKLSESLKKDPKTGAEVPTEQYNGQTLYVKQDKGEQVAAAVLDASTLVIGSPVAMVKSAIDAHGGKADNATKNTELFDLFKATKSTGVLRFAMRFPQEQLPKNEDPMAKSFSTIKYLSGALEATTGVGLDLTARTASAADAKPLHDQLQGLLAMGKGQLGGNPQMEGIVSVLNQTTLSMADADVKMTINIPNDVLAKLANDFGKMAGGMGGGAMEPGSMPDGDTAKP
jgi:hypothetical protein